MKSLLQIPLGRQIQLAVAVFVLLPATLSYGPLRAWFEPADVMLRGWMTPSAVIADKHKPIVIDVPTTDGAADAAQLTQLLREMNAAASVTLTDPLPHATEALVEATRYNGAAYLTDARDSNGQGSSAEIRAAARGIGHARLPETTREQFDGLQAWQLSGNSMRASAALIPLLPDTRWRERSAIQFDSPNLKIIPTRGSAINSLSVAEATHQQHPLSRMVENKHVFMGSAVSSGLNDFARLHTALASGKIISQPRWAQSLSWLTISLAMFALVSGLWRESRKIIAISAMTITVGLLVMQWVLAYQWHVQIDMLRPLFAVLSGCLVCFGLTPDRNSNRRESFRSGLKYMRGGKLDTAFRVFKNCPAHPSLMPTLYKLAIAFDKAGQPEQSRSVFAYMAGRDKNEGRSAPTAKPTRSAVPSNIPEKLGRYEVLRPLGSGAMGGVFLGRDPRINRLIALKIVSFSAYDDEATQVEARARFFQEAESAGRLTHPAITAVYDSGEENGLGYIAMEYVPGEQMTRYTAEPNLLDPVAVMRALTTVAEALDYAHGEHVVHRDIKPANLIYDPATESIKITDFGVAKLIDAERTQTGLILGTPSYMSPEQTGGGNVTGSSDLFSLGVTLYELLTGAVPFHGKTMAELMAAINKNTPQPLSSLRADLPPGIDEFMQQALAKQPENRFVNGNDMAFELRQCASQMFNRVVNQ